MTILLKNPVFIVKDNLVCPASATPAEPATIFEADIGGQYGATLYSLSISFSSTFTQNYYYLLSLDGVQLGDASNPNNYQQPDITAPAIDFIKQDTAIKLQPHAKLTIKGYNNTDTTSVGTLSVLIYKDDNSAHENIIADNRGINFGSPLI